MFVGIMVFITAMLFVYVENIPLIPVIVNTNTKKKEYKDNFSAL